MPQIVSQRDARVVKKLPFCYVCGNTFVGSEEVTDDHVPPRAAFLPEDRENFPLVLRAHKGCNHAFHLEDEVFGQLLGIGHTVDQTHSRLRVSGGSVRAGNAFAVLENLDLHGVIRRWIAAFHAALYQEPIPPLTRFSTQTPLPSGRFLSGELIPDPDMPQFLDYTKQIEVNERLGLIDCIRANNGKLNYRCCWQRSDMGPWFALYRLDLYDWSKPGDTENFRLRPCIGAYASPGHIPSLATRGTELWSVGS